VCEKEKGGKTAKPKEFRFKKRKQAAGFVTKEKDHQQNPGGGFEEHLSTSGGEWKGMLQGAN